MIDDSLMHFPAHYIIIIIIIIILLHYYDYYDYCYYDYDYYDYYYYIETCLSHYQTDTAVNHCQLGLRRSVLVRTVTVTDRVMTSVMQCGRWGMCCICPKEQCIRQ